MRFWVVLACGVVAMAVAATVAWFVVKHFTGGIGDLKKNSMMAVPLDDDEDALAALLAHPDAYNVTRLRVSTDATYATVWVDAYQEGEAIGLSAGDLAADDLPLFPERAVQPVGQFRFQLTPEDDDTPLALSVGFTWSDQPTVYYQVQQGGALATGSDELALPFKAGDLARSWGAALDDGDQTAVVKDQPVLLATYVFGDDGVSVRLPDSPEDDAAALVADQAYALLVWVQFSDTAPTGW
jgi:hypothetical protein